MKALSNFLLFTVLAAVTGVWMWATPAAASTDLNSSLSAELIQLAPPLPAAVPIVAVFTWAVIDHRLAHLALIGLVMAFAACAWLPRRYRSRWVSVPNDNYDADIVVHERTIRRTADNGTAARHLLVKRTGLQTVDLAGATDVPLGTVDNILLAGEPAEVLLLGKGSTKKMVTNVAITDGQQVYNTGAGLVTNTPVTGCFCVGTALTATGGTAGEVLEVRDTAPTIAHV